MLQDRMTTNELFTALEALNDDKTHDLIKELRLHQIDLEIQNRELREIQQQLARSRVRYADLYDFSPIGYASLDENCRIEEINITAGKLLGDNPPKLIGRSFNEFIASEHTEDFREHLARCRLSQKKRSIQLRLLPRQASP